MAEKNLDFIGWVRKDINKTGRKSEITIHKNNKKAVKMPLVKHLNCCKADGFGLKIGLNFLSFKTLRFGANIYLPVAGNKALARSSQGQQDFLNTNHTD